MTANIIRRPKVFISYSHDSPEHMERVLQLSEKLRSEGIDCEIDQYEMSPKEGWPKWMINKISEARFVLVVCTEVYFNRVQGKGSNRRGLGAKWEGAIITQELYNSGGCNEKYIPIIFTEKDKPYIPIFLKGVTHYNLKDNQDYIDLYRYLTNQPPILKSNLGQIRVLPSQEHTRESSIGQSEQPPVDDPTLKSIILLHIPEGKIQFFRSESVELSDKINLELLSTSAEQNVFLSKLMSSNQSVGIAFGDTAFLTDEVKATQQRKAGVEKWTITMNPIDVEYGGGLMETSTSNLSANKIAEMRARRILLNEKLQRTGTGPSETFNDIFLESLVRGQNTPLQVEGSPFPALYKLYGHVPDLFVTICRLVGIYYLRLAWVVEYISKLDLSMHDKAILAVSFEGQRAKQYVNVDPPIIKIKGNCNLKE